MTVNVEYFYGRVSKGIVFFLMTVWTFIIGFLPMIINWSTHGRAFGDTQSASTIFTVLIVFCSVLSVVWFVIGCLRVRGSTKAKNILKNGKPAVGAMSSLTNTTIYYQGFINTKKLIFVYKTEDGRIGKTTQYISGDVLCALKRLETREIPIRLLGDRAVVDEKKLLTGK